MADKPGLIDISVIRKFYENNPLDLCRETVDFDFLSLFVHSKDELPALLLDLINTGRIKQQSSIRFRSEDTEESTFVLIEKGSGEIRLSVIIKCISDTEFQIVSVFPTVNSDRIHVSGCYYPDSCELSGVLHSAVGLSETDFFDYQIPFEHDYFEDDNHDDVEWNIFGVAYTSSSAAARYNGSDGIDDLIPYRKVSIRTSSMEPVIFDGIVFYKCYADAALFPEYCVEGSDLMGIKVPLYISEKSGIKVEELHDGSLVDAVIFGNIRVLSPKLSSDEFRGYDR